MCPIIIGDPPPLEPRHRPLDNWDLEITVTAGGLYEAIDIRGSSRGRPMMFTSGTDLSAVEQELYLRYAKAKSLPHSTAMGNIVRRYIAYR